MIIAASILLQVVAPSIGRVEISLLRYGAQIENYALITTLLIAVFAWCTLKSICLWIWRSLRLGSKKKIDDKKAADAIATLILSDDYEFLPLAMKTTIPAHLQVVKTAVLLFRGCDKIEATTEETAPQIVNINIMKRNIQKLLKSGDIVKSIALVRKATDKYTRYATIIKDEILEIALLSRENGIKFNFDPSKFKYNFSRSFMEEYCVSIALLEFRLEHNNDAKLKILEKIFSNYPANSKVAITLLDFITEQGHSDATDKKIISIIKQAFALNPNRILAYYLLKVNRKDLFEVAQTIVSTVIDTNIDKVWFMLIVSTKLNLVAKVKEIIKHHLFDQNCVDDLSKFYIQNHEILSKDGEIVEIIGEIYDRN
jgi:hypothetical protein